MKSIVFFLVCLFSGHLFSVSFHPKYLRRSLSQKSLRPLKSTNYNEIISDSSCIYDKDKVEEFYSSRPLLVLSRLIDVGTPILDWWVTKKIDSFLAKYRTEEENQYYLNQRASELREAIVKGKSVTFIKSGQALALRPDIVKYVE